jgi:nanoRNase/pAp phosphatase (c-di-AMP/oligoRNAs hydrolase)
MDASKQQKPALPGQYPKGYKPTWQESIQQVNALLTPVKEAVIVLRPNPDFDTVAAGLALGLSMKKIGRRSRIVTPSPINPEAVFADIKKEEVPEVLIANLDQIVNYLPAKQLQITVDYSSGSFAEGKMDKVENGLSLTMVPEQGQPPIEPQNVATQIIESRPDVAITLGLENLFNLNDFYRQNQNFFTKTTIINIDNHSNNMNYGKGNLIDAKASCLSEMVTLMLYDLRFTLDEDVSKMLYFGIKQKTEGFAQKNFTANMLEAVSISLRYQQQVPAK